MNSLGTWQRCPICREYGFSGQHTCKPEWEACDADNMEWQMVRGSTMEDAAEAYCTLRDRFAEYSEVTGSREVLIRPIGRNDLRRRYTVYGKLQPVYHATLQQYVGELIGKEDEEACSMNFSGACIFEIEDDRPAATMTALRRALLEMARHMDLQRGRFSFTVNVREHDPAPDFPAGKKELIVTLTLHS